MASTFGSLAKSLRGAAEGLPNSANDLKKKIAGTVHLNCMDRTLVDTGEAMSNWIVNNASAITEPRPAFVPSPRARMLQITGTRSYTHTVPTETTRQANRAPALDAANAALSQATPGVPIHITNSVPHIGFLDNGTDRIEPANFARSAIIFAEGLISRYKLL